MEIIKKTLLLSDVMAKLNQLADSLSLDSTPYRAYIRLINSIRKTYGFAKSQGFTAEHKTILSDRTKTLVTAALDHSYKCEFEAKDLRNFFGYATPYV